MTATSRRPAIFGPEPWAEVSGSRWCHFDRWFALVAVASFDGDLDALEQSLVERLRSSLRGRRDVEAKLSHLADLRDRMAAAGIDVQVLAAFEPADQATSTKARRKVLEQALDGRAMTEAMRLTPRVRLERRARFGHWDTFPVNPSRWYDELTGRGAVGFVSKGGSFAATRLRARLAAGDDPGLSVAERLALYRAFHTVGVEVAEYADDSYGNVGELRLDAFRTYISIDWASAGMAAEVYWRDLGELLVAESYALTSREETLPFRRVPAGQADMIEAILLVTGKEWRAAYQDYHGDEAEELVAWLHLAGRRYRRYTEVAGRLGSKLWQPIVALAESALAAGNPSLAVEIFRAADQPGAHRDYLRGRCFELTGTRLGDAPRGWHLVR